MASQGAKRNLGGRVALITGGSRGIGEACAEAMADAGARAVAVARKRGDLDRSADRSGSAVETWAEDVNEQRFLRRLERLDILVNNAGTNAPQPFVDISEEVLDEMIAVNVRAMFLTARSAARVMLRNGECESISMNPGLRPCRPCYVCRHSRQPRGAPRCPSDATGRCSPEAR